MFHVVLLGDSIFDNASYVPGKPAVIDQLRIGLADAGRATLLAVDGSVIEHVSEQIREVPDDATHLVISAGGNDALTESPILRERCQSVAEALELLEEARRRFRANYRAMLEAVAALGKPTAVCTVYDQIPGLESADSVALGIFNEVILREAISFGAPIIDLRLVCSRRDDFSPLSPIEPSVAGGSKITRAIKDLVRTHDFQKRSSRVYV